MNEWEFTGDINSWINKVLDRTPIPPFDRSKVEQTGTGSRKRRDLTLLDKSKLVLITGEIKLPYQADGNSPYISKVVTDARKKARRAKARFFFTWNVNECVLWETDPADPSKLGQDYKSWHVTRVHNETQLEHRATEEEIRDWLVKFLHAVAQILEGTVKIGRKPPDEKFIDTLESSLKMPIQFSYDELDQLDKKKRERTRIEKWMREEQGWTIYDDPDGKRENLERASRFACYALVNKLVFHEALLKRYGRRLDKLLVPAYIDTGDQLWTHLEAYFKDAIKVTSDYETVFGEDHRSIGNRIPFYSDDAVPHWRALIDQIHEFDFSKLDYEVIGTMFERLLSPEERHKYGQYYTRVEIVDLINSYCIRNGDEKVMDPACGGGTFLIRAYARMKVLKPEQQHGEILKNIFGVDIMNFATHLTTINLAIRDLIDDENYPQIVRSDFFDVQSDKIFATLPRKIKSGGLGKTQQREVEIPSLDAIIGNPPYIRQEEIPKKKKTRYQGLIKKESNAAFSGRSDIHCYFWPHATTFLKRNGYLCLLTSSQWLDVEYGFKLQEWILRNFEIHAIFESIDEPWFVGARVATTVTILKRQSDETKRMSNTVRFVQLRRPMSEILANDGSAAGTVQAADEFRDEITGLTKNALNDRYRVRLVSQKKLWDTGVALGAATGKTDSVYCGGKWGVYLRAPDIWFELMESLKNGTKSLGELADISRGIRSGKDSFFYPRDCSIQLLEETDDEEEFEGIWHVARQDVENGKVKLVKCGDKYSQVKAIEHKYLKSIVHSALEIDSLIITAEHRESSAFYVSTDDVALNGTHAKKYILWGESNGYDKSSSAATKETSWFDLTHFAIGEILWPIAHQYKHLAALNKDQILVNQRLINITNDEIPADCLAGVLNSTIVLLSKVHYSRPVGNEGYYDTTTLDLKMLPVPDFSASNESSILKVGDKFRALASRPPLQFLSEQRLRKMAYIQTERENELESLSDLCELDMDDRRELDDTVLQMMGVTSKKRRTELIDALYDYLRQFFEIIRQKEEKAIVNKNLYKRRGRFKPADVATQILDEIQSTETWLLQQYDTAFLDKDKPFDSYDIPDEGVPQYSSDMFTGRGLSFIKGKKQTAGHVQTRHKEQDDLITLLVQDNIRGLLRVPHTPRECEKVNGKYTNFIKRRDKKLCELVAGRTSDEELQEKIFDALKEQITDA